MAKGSDSTLIYLGLGALAFLYLRSQGATTPAQAGEQMPSEINVPVMVDTQPVTVNGPSPMAMIGSTQPAAADVVTILPRPYIPWQPTDIPSSNPNIPLPTALTNSVAIQTADGGWQIVDRKLLRGY